MIAAGAARADLPDPSRRARLVASPIPEIVIMQTPVTLGVIVGNRGFFPAHLCEEGRTRVLAAIEQEGLRSVALDPQATTYGAVESLDEARTCADLFRAHRNEIDGVIVTLPNFGDERAIANTLR